MTGLRLDDYAWSGGREAMLRFGPDDGPIIVAALPLFEEANRTRAFVVTILRALADHGVGSILPDLPGQGDSLVPLDTLSLRHMQSAYEEAVRNTGLASRGYALGLRSGALLDTLGLLKGRWHLAPQDGAGLLRDLARVHQLETGLRASGDVWWRGVTEGPNPAVTIAGNRLSDRLLTDLLVDKSFDRPALPRRVVRLTSDPLPADRKVEGAPLWRRSEPGNDPSLARLLAADIAHWIAACEG